MRLGLVDEGLLDDQRRWLELGHRVLRDEVLLRQNWRHLLLREWIHLWLYKACLDLERRLLNWLLVSWHLHLLLLEGLRRVLTHVLLVLSIRCVRRRKLELWR